MSRTNIEHHQAAEPALFEGDAHAFLMSVYNDTSLPVEMGAA